MEALHSSHPSVFRRAGVRPVELCPPSLPHARGQSLARSHGLPHPELLRLGDALVLRFAFRRRHARGAHSHVRLEGLAGIAAAGFCALWGAPDLAAFTPANGPGHRDRGGPSPGRGAGDFQSLLAHDPGARAVYRRGDLRGRRVRQDLGLYAPFRQAASRLASRESTDAGGGAHA